MNPIIRRELRVAFDRRNQPIWFRIVKYLFLVGLIVYYRRLPFFWWVLAGILVGGILLHGFYWYKTRTWTRSYGRGLFRWNYDKLKPD